MHFRPSPRQQVITQIGGTTSAATALIHKHRPRISSFLRLANYDCQSKGSMLIGFANPTVLEIGAHDGEEWEQFQNKVAKLWAVEPSPDKKTRLVAKTASMKMSGLQFFPVAISAESGELKFWVDGANSQQNTVGHPPPWVSQERFEKEAIRVPAKTLDEFWLSDLKGEHITMIKVDTQGHEPAVLMSGKTLFSSDPPDIIHMEFSPRLMERAHLDGKTLLEFVYDFGYLCFDCAAFGPPPLETNRFINSYAAGFGSFDFNGADHGQWTDLVCLM